MVEILIALAIIILAVLALVKLSTYSVKSSSFAKQKAQAANYATSGIENMRVYRDRKPDDFWSKSGNLDLSGVEPGGTCPSTPNLGVYIRCVDFTLVNDSKMQVKVMVSWDDSQGTHKAEQTTYFTKW